MGRRHLPILSHGLLALRHDTPEIGGDRIFYDYGLALVM